MAKGKKVKLKTKKALLRRVKITGRGKLLRARSFNRHLKAGKSRKKTRALSRTVEVKGNLAKKWKKVLGI